MTLDPVQTEIFKHLFAAIAEEMGVVLRRSSYSPNIKERLDFSCALFDPQGDMVAQAAHIPVHLGALPHTVQACLKRLKLRPGDVVMLNDPFQGGTHLPDITVVTPVYSSINADQLLGLVASRAHHADVGGSTPGSMGIEREIYQEGLIIPPVKIQVAGQLNQAALDLILANVRTPDERLGDLTAQIAANAVGVERFRALEVKFGVDRIRQAQDGLLSYAERLTRDLLRGLPEGRYEFEDRLDDDGISDEPVEIRVAIEIRGEAAEVDFTGSARQRPGGINAVYPVTLAATYYAFRCLLSLDAPTNSGGFRPMRVVAPPGTVVNARHPAAVAGGNVETSQRITDVVLGALAQAVPSQVPAASQGTMNNLTIGGWSPEHRRPFAYYETIAGGCGGLPDRRGASAVHSHMTNTMNTPVEALEYAYPLRVRRYAIREGSGGQGAFAGGDGVVREIELLTDAQVSLLCERRKHGPYGLQGGESGRPGRDQLLEGDQRRHLPGKGSFSVERGGVVRVETPGGGGYGRAR